MEKKIKEKFSTVTIIYGILSLIAFYVAYSFSRQNYSMIVILLPVYFGVVLLAGGARNIIKKPEREVKWERFLREVWMEVIPPHGKVTWPDRKTVFGSTVIVLIVVFLGSSYLGLVDVIFSKLMKALSGWIRGVIS